MSGDDYDDNNDNNGGSVNLVRLLVWYVSIFQFLTTQAKYEVNTFMNILIRG